MTFMDERAIAYAISADMSAPLKQAILALPNDHWKPADVEAGRVREWAEVNYLPDDGVYKKDQSRRAAIWRFAFVPPKAICWLGGRLRHFCIVTNRSDPRRQHLDIISWHRAKQRSSTPTTC